MRIRLAAAIVILATQPGLALAEVDKLSGAPLPAPAKPERPSPIHDHFYILGAFYSPTVSTTVRYDPTTAGVPAGTTGTTVNAERDLGLPARLHQGRVEFMFRMRERHKLRVEYYEGDRSASHVLANDIVFGNQTYLTGQQVQSSVNWRSFGLTYTYSLIHTDSFELGTGLGVFGLQAEAMGAVPATGQSADEWAAEPLPTLPLDLTWCISKRFSLNARANYISAHVSGYHGSFSDLHGDLQYRWNPYFSLGLGYTSLHLSVSGDSRSWAGVANSTFKGPEAFIRFSY
jgi:hypothetical protein